MNTRTPGFAYVTATAGGALLWLGTRLVSGRTEAWDAPAYWTVTYPLAIALAVWLGWRVPRGAWRWGLVVMLAQAVTLAATASGFSLLPLGLIVFGVLALPAIALAQLAATFRLRYNEAGNG